VPDSVRDPLGYYRNNTVNSRALIATAIECGVRSFIFSSTAAVYGNPAAVPVSEDAPALPISPYGWSKLMTEIMLRDASRAHGMSHAILRYFNVAGADPRGRTGQSTPAATHLIKVCRRNGARTAAQIRNLRQRLPDARRHLHPRLHPHQRSYRGAFAGAAVFALRWDAADAQLRLRPRLFGARGRRYGQTRLRNRF
jgi:nucleoside-diphosphate-sugar epimerase